MRRISLWLGVLILMVVMPTTSEAQSDVIKSAMSAGPMSVSSDATIMNWNLEVVREGTNGWTCLPDRSDTPGNDPWCINDPWLNFLKAYVAKTAPTYTGVGIAYMLMGDTPVSNSNPYASEATGPGDWVTGLGAHLMVLFPDHTLLGTFPADHRNGGPWVMWPDTPYAHLMIPIAAHGGSH